MNLKTNLVSTDFCYLEYWAPKKLDYFSEEQMYSCNWLKSTKTHLMT